jgi:y4mF family transcriptional regulator
MQMDPLMVIERLGQQISEMRKNRGMTQIDLAESAGVTRQKLSEIERGKATVSINLYAKVLAALGAELTVVAARRPSFEELREVFR